MLKNITLSADEKLIQEARQKASNENTTLNAKFRSWLHTYVQREQLSKDAELLIEELQAKYSTNGRKFTRDEMNERR